MSELQYFVIHYFALPERRRYIESALAAAGESAQFIEIERSNPDLPRVLYAGDELEWCRKARSVYSSAPPFRALTRPETHNAASHVLAIRSIEAEWGVIIEDDAILDADFFATVRTELRGLPPAIGCVFLGGGFPHERVSATLATFGRFHLKSHPATNTVVAYALRRNVAERAGRSCRGIDLPFDFELSYLLMANNVLVAHLIPYIAREGSKTGAYASAIENLRQKT